MDITYERLSGSLGSLLLVWAALEKSLRDEVACAYGSLPPKAYGIAAVLRTWTNLVIESQPATSLGPLLATSLRGQLQGPLDIRNGLCHGLVGISAASAQSPAQLHWEINNEAHAICWDELQQYLQWFSRLPRAISIISKLSMERLENRATNIAENREWWRSEFALDLPEP